jgi:hypothetical protein
MDEEIEDELAVPLSSLLFNGEGNAPGGQSGTYTVLLFACRPFHTLNLTVPFTPP